MTQSILLLAILCRYSENEAIDDAKMTDHSSVNFLIAYYKYFLCMLTIIIETQEDSIRSLIFIT